MRIGLAGIDSSHAEDFVKCFNAGTHRHDTIVTAFWSRDENRAAQLLSCAPQLRAAPSLADLVDSVDAVIVGDRHGDLHLQHALPAIEAGKPVFIDKPLACKVRDARLIIEAAERLDVPLMSASALRWQTDTVLLKARLAYVDGPLAIRGHGTWYPDSEYGGAIFYAIHTIELLQELVGTEWTALRIEPGSAPVIRYEAGRASVTMTLRPLGPSGASAFGVGVTSPQLTCDKPIPLGDDYMAPVADRIVGMLRTGRGMDRETLLAPIRLMTEIEACLR